MKTASSELIAFLNSKDIAQIVDVYTFNLIGGEVLRWTSGDDQIYVNGYNYILGPAISRSKIKNKRGVTPSKVTIEIDADEDDLVFGKPIIQFIINKNFDGATVVVDRVYRRETGDVVGYLNWFTGRVTRVTDATRSHVSMEASDWRILLNVDYPSDTFDTSCRHTVFDGGCQLLENSFKITNAVSSASTKSTLNTTLSQASGYFNLGYLVFTSGLNIGERRAVKSYSGSGVLSLIVPLPYAPNIGDTFYIIPGCDGLKATCLSKFNNLNKFGGVPFIPEPEVSL